MPPDFVIKPRLLQVLAWLAIAFAVLLFVLQGLSLQNHISSDFKIYYWAAKHFVDNPMLLYQESSRLTLSGYLYPPPSIFLFLPLQLVSLEIGFQLFSPLILLSALIALLLWLRLLVKADLAPSNLLLMAAILSLAIVSGSVFSGRAGQIDAFVLLLCVIAVALAESMPLLAGAIISVGAWIKIYPALLIFYAMTQASFRRFLCGFLVAGITIPGLACTVIPIDLMFKYFLDILPSLSGRTIINIDNQSLQAIGVRAMIPLSEAINSFAAYPVPSLLRWGGNVMALSMILLTACLVRRRKSKNLNLYIAAVIMAMIPLMAPLGWGHTYIYVLPLFCLMVSRAASHSLPSLLVALFVYLAFVFPSHHNFQYLQGMPDFFLELLFARYAIATIVLCILSWRFILSEK
jgi:alpha-1,2-mannosyltransferase